MGPPKIDFVICSKDRTDKLLVQIPALNKLPHNELWIYEGSLKPDLDRLRKLKEKYGVRIILVPYLKFGNVRAKVMEYSTADFVAMVDDDVKLCPNWLELLMSEFKDKDVAAASSKIIYDWKFLKKMCFKNIRGTGESGGAAIYKRDAILALGNFNKKIHVGEDMELKLRVNKLGRKWVRSRHAYALHPITLKEYLNRPKGYAIGWKFIMSYNQRKWRFLLTRFGAIFVMPFYYFLQTGDLRVLGVYFLYKLNAMISFLRLGDKTK